jgi:hypothetical protein
MAYYAPVNGDSQPVFALDTQNGPVAPSTSLAGAPVQPQGPKLDFFRLVANTSVNGEGGVQEYVANVMQAIQQTSTVAMYQVDGTILSFGVFPTGAFGDSSANPPTTTSAALFLAAANITYTGFQLDSCTSIGFKLAAS